MSRPQYQQIRKLCQRPETYTHAEALLHAAVAKTGPGSGYELGRGTTGLPAICAHLASNELGNGDVSEKIAQTASCLAPKDFKTALNTIRAALAASAPQEATARVPATYEGLLRQSKLGNNLDFILSSLRTAERALVATRELHDDFRPPCDAVTVAVFCWTLSELLEVKKIKPATLLRVYTVPQPDYDAILDILRTSCGDAAEQIKHGKAALSKGAKARKAAADPGPSTPSRRGAQTPSKSRSPTKSPSKSALRNDDIATSPAKTPTHKRKVAFSDGPDGSEGASDGDLDAAPSSVEATPSKRPKFATSSAGYTYRASPAKAGVFPANVGGTRSTLDFLQPVQEDDMEMEAQFPAIADTPGAGPSTPRRRVSRSASASSGAETPRMSRPTMRYEEPVRARRFRPVFWEQRQWLQRDPKIEREWRAAEVAVRDIVMRYRAGSGRGVVSIAT